MLHKHGLMLLRNQVFMENNNQCFEKIEDCFSTEIAKKYIVYRRMSFFLNT